LQTTGLVKSNHFNRNYLAGLGFYRLIDVLYAATEVNSGLATGG
jgi:hypothetical protein